VTHAVEDDSRAHRRAARRGHARSFDWVWGGPRNHQGPLHITRTSSGPRAHGTAAYHGTVRVDSDAAHQGALPHGPACRLEARTDLIQEANGRDPAVEHALGPAERGAVRVRAGEFVVLSLRGARTARKAEREARSAPLAPPATGKAHPRTTAVGDDTGLNVLSGQEAASLENVKVVRPDVPLLGASANEALLDHEDRVALELEWQRLQDAQSSAADDDVYVETINVEVRAGGGGAGASTCTPTRRQTVLRGRRPALDLCRNADARPRGSVIQRPGCRGIAHVAAIAHRIPKSVRCKEQFQWVAFERPGVELKQPSGEPGRVGGGGSTPPWVGPGGEERGGMLACHPGGDGGV